MPEVGDDSDELLRALDAELAELDLRDSELVTQLRDAVARQLSHARAASSDHGSLPVAPAAEVCGSVLRAVSDLGRSATDDGPDPVNQRKFAELADLQRQLAEAHRDPRHVEHQTFRDLLRALPAGRTRR